MNITLKRALQVAFLVVLIWALAALAGAAPGAKVSGPGFSARIGKGACGRRRRHLGYGRNNPASVANGMVGELVSSAGTNVPPVGWPYSVGI